MAGRKATGTNRRTEGSLESTPEEHKHSGFPSGKGGERSALVVARLPSVLLLVPVAFLPAKKAFLLYVGQNLDIHSVA